MRQLEARHSPLPATIEAITGGGGRRLYFRQPEHPIQCSAGQLGAGLDVRGDGGYVIAPPSIHPSGRAYAWSVDSAREFDDAPEWLFDLLGKKQPAHRPDDEWSELAAERHGEGTRNAAMLSLCGLIVRGVAPFVPSKPILHLMQGYNLGMCDPPLADEHVKDIVLWCVDRDIANQKAKRHAR